MKYFEVQFRKDNEGMNYSEEYADRRAAHKAFDEAELSPENDVIELMEFDDEDTVYEGKLLKTKSLEHQVPNQ